MRPREAELGFDRDVGLLEQQRLADGLRRYA